MPSEMVVAEEREAKTCLCCLWRHTEVMARQATGNSAKEVGNVTRPPLHRHYRSSQVGSPLCFGNPFSIKNDFINKGRRKKTRVFYGQQISESADHHVMNSPILVILCSLGSFGWDSVLSHFILSGGTTSILRTFLGGPVEEKKTCSKRRRRPGRENTPGPG